MLLTLLFHWAIQVPQVPVVDRRYLAMAQKRSWAVSAAARPFTTVLSQRLWLAIAPQREFSAEAVVRNYEVAL